MESINPKNEESINPKKKNEITNKNMDSLKKNGSTDNRTDVKNDDIMQLAFVDIDFFIVGELLLILVFV